MKHLVVLALLLLVAGAGIVWQAWKPGPVVYGNLSQADVNQIVRAVRRDVWRQCFPDSSWQTIKRAPKALVWVSATRVSEVIQTSRDRARVRGSSPLEFEDKGGMKGMKGMDYWDLKRGAAGWTVQGGGSTPGVANNLPAVRPPAKPFDSGVSFSEFITNRARVSLGGKP